MPSKPRLCRSMRFIITNKKSQQLCNWCKDWLLNEDITRHCRWISITNCNCIQLDCVWVDRKRVREFIMRTLTIIIVFVDHQVNLACNFGRIELQRRSVQLNSYGGGKKTVITIVINLITVRVKCGVLFMHHDTGWMDGWMNGWGRCDR